MNIYTFIQAGKNDSQPMWPLRTTVQLLFIDVGGDTYHVAEISGTWKKPGRFKYDCWTADKSNFIIIAPPKVSASVNIICTSTCLFLFETFSL